MRGVRGRLTITIVALVALTGAVLGIGSYAFVDYSLHQRVRDDAAAQARSDLSAFIPGRLPQPTPSTFEASGLRAVFAARGVDVLPDFGEGLPAGLRGVVSTEYSASIDRGELAYEWTSLAGTPRLIVGGRMPGTTVAFHFIHDASAIETALGQLRLGLGGGALLLVLLAVVASRLVARGVLAPVEQAARAAQRIERGDLSARLPVTSRDELGALADRFNRMVEALDETIGRLRASQAQNRRFVADVSHELRTPLAALVAEASIFREHLDELPPGARRAGELLTGDVQRLRTLVEELMELSRFDSEAEQVSLEPVDLGRLVGVVAAARLPDARLDLPADPLIVESDPRRLERILANLLDNAREHAPGAPVEVEVRPSGDRVLLAVADGGPGVPPDRLERIFDRFYKVDPSRRGAGSSGLGLAIAAEHAGLLGATLAAHNRPQGGLRFELLLPVTEPLPGGDGRATSPGDAPSPKPIAREPVT